MFVSPPNPHNEPQKTTDISSSQSDTVVAMDAITDNVDSSRESSSDLTDFRLAVAQLLDLLMSESFCHPYGIIAGTVA